ncbi:MAG: trigger factor [Eubacteriales bacterium]|nr:trigger factor [Eubacteriales bacterium]MCI6980159.1 trigger factor [Clostridiales bacterium]
MASFEKLESNKVKLGMTISAEDFDKAVDKAYLKLRKTITVPGFRKGHAPKGVIEKAYGWYVFVDDAFDEAYPAVYEAAVKEHDVKPVDRPDITILSAEKGEDVAFEAVVTVMPEVSLGQYKGIEVEKQEYNVTDEMVNAEIERERENVARMIDVERPIENGDEVELDYSGTVNGVKFEGGTAEHQTLVIGSGMFIPGFEEQMIGMNVGEEKDLNVKFPDEYHSDELKGKDAVFHVKVHAVRVKELPEADDEFAKDVSEFNTIAELRDHKKEELEKKAMNEAKAKKENDVIEKAVANATVDIPDVMIDRQADRMLNDIRYRLSMQGISLEDYCKYTGTKTEVMKAEMKNEAERRVKTQLVLDAIMKAEGIKAENDEVDKKIDEYCAQFDDKAEEFKAKLNEDDKAYFEDQVLLDKTINMLVDSAIEK